MLPWAVTMGITPTPPTPPHSTSEHYPLETDLLHILLYLVCKCFDSSWTRGIFTRRFLYSHSSGFHPAPHIPPLLFAALIGGFTLNYAVLRI